MRERGEEEGKAWRGKWGSLPKNLKTPVTNLSLVIEIEMSRWYGFDTREMSGWNGFDTRETLRWYGFDTREMLRWYGFGPS